MINDIRMLHQITGEKTKELMNLAAQGTTI